jgi:hypothetical protein
VRKSKPENKMQKKLFSKNKTKIFSSGNLNERFKRKISRKYFKLLLPNATNYGTTKNKFQRMNFQRHPMSIIVKYEIFLYALAKLH